MRRDESAKDRLSFPLRIEPVGSPAIPHLVDGSSDVRICIRRRTFARARARVRLAACTKDTSVLMFYIGLLSARTMQQRLLRHGDMCAESRREA